MGTTKRNPYGETWKPSKGRLEVPDFAAPQPWNFRKDAAVALGWFWYEGRLWQKPPTFRDWAHEFAFRCGRMAATERVWMGHGLIRALVANPPAEPEKPQPKATEREFGGLNGQVADHLPDPFTVSMQGIIRTDETIDGAIVDEVAEQSVMLDVAFTPVLPYPTEDLFGMPRCALTHGTPMPCEVIKMDDGGYSLIARRSADMQRVSETALKVMRARYLLARGVYWRHMRVMPHGERQEVLARFFPGGTWTPQEGSPLAAAMGMVGEPASA